ncbi:MAG TPA: DDE-type integrase/transposase/recombinase [Mogibacterium sp.]|nr:DDE-type integrase/transposase/recombinase [Mogibacterium sp.]
MVHQIKVSHVTISKWIKRFTPVFQRISSDKLLGVNLCDSDEWHFDEAYIKISGKDYYLWLAFDSETRLVIDFHLSPNRDSDAAHNLLANCRRKFGQPRSVIISDRYYAYQQPASLCCLGFHIYALKRCHILNQTSFFSLSILCC